VQDAGSQMIAAACAAERGMTVLDLCAGAGGKTLALAADMDGPRDGAGRLIAADTGRDRLARLVPRAQRAGANIETRLLDPGKELAALGDIAGACDLVLVDAPCSGSGTWRRNPEARWRLTPARLDRIVALQAHILDYAASLVKPGGRLVFAVCSLLDREGREQAEAFLDRHPEWHSVSARNSARVHGPGTLLLPRRDGTDGFFFATLANN
jgi:16S rRNA (cytosine967-C5)-methyltransferase